MHLRPLRLERISDVLKDEMLFWNKVLIGDGCWLWTAGVDKDGYGKYRLGGLGSKTVKASRASYMFNIGPIPKGLGVLHTCDTPACVRPSHLFLGTDADNSADKVRKGRQPRGEANGGGGKLTRRQVDEMRRLYGMGGYTHKQLARQFGVNRSLVGMIMRGEIWR